MPEQEKLLAFPVYPGVTPLDLVGPLTVLRTRPARLPPVPRPMRSTIGLLVPAIAARPRRWADVGR